MNSTFRRLSLRLKRSFLSQSGKTLPKTVAIVLFSALLLSAFSPARAAQRETALDAFVHAPDPSYHYKYVREFHQTGYTIYLLRMTSQKWRTAKEVNRPLWKHWVAIYKPQRVISSIGMVYLMGGVNNGKQPGPDPLPATIATTSHTVVTEVYNIPNEPLTFKANPQGPIAEDQLMSYTWKKFLQTRDPSWPLLLPMTRAVVRTMDTVTSFMTTKRAGGINVNHFVIMGGSKRGWATWLTAATDHRVVAIVPMVIDVLNFVACIEHQYHIYGSWSEATKPYYDRGLLDDLETKGFRELMDEINPYSYRKRFTLPKLLINSAGDPFFLPDSSRFYFKKLPGVKCLRYMPNHGHGLSGRDIVENMMAFYMSVVDHSKRPRFNWTFEKNGDIRLVTEEKPISVKLWQATNPASRDFRFAWVGPIYKESALRPSKPGVYVAHVIEPPKGWTAFFIEVDYPGAGKFPFRFTTAARVIPNTEPYPGPIPAKTRLGPPPRLPALLVK